MHGGFEQGTEGDSFFVLFEEVPPAIAAAIDGQRALADEPWPEDATLRVRMGLHTGGAERVGSGYVGIAINQAARIADAAHGGQILVSGPTGALGGEAPADGVRLLDLGEHRLKDVSSPVRILQVTADDLPAEFPPIQHARRSSEQPADPTDDVRRSRRRTRGGRVIAGHDPTADPHRTRRDRQDTTLAAACRPGIRRLLRRRLLRPARADP